MIQHVKADSLASVFTNNTLSSFTLNAILKGVNDDSIIYIVCNSTDASIFGSKYVEGSHWIWAKGEMFGTSEKSDKGYRYNTANGAFAEGDRDIVVGETTSIKSTATGRMSHAEGCNTSATGHFSHAEGQETTASGYYSHSEGYKSKAQYNVTHAEGNSTIASGDCAHSEGYSTKASGSFTHAEGISTIAKGTASHAEGDKTTANGINSHAEGGYTIANGGASHSEGRFTQTLNNGEHAEGSYNISHKATDGFNGNAGNTLHSIGIGTAENARKNAVEVMQNGDAYLIGVGNYDGVHIKGETGYETVQTLQEVVSGKQDALIEGQNIHIADDNTISAVIDAGFSVEVVTALPTTGKTNTIYFVPISGGGTDNSHDEYMYIKNKWEKIGNTSVDLSNYYNKTETDNLLSNKQATLTAGNNITIDGNTIAAKGYRYDASTGAFAEGDRDIVYSGTTYDKPSATGVMAHAEGSNTKAIGRSSHAEGNGGSAGGENSHVEGHITYAHSQGGHAEGRYTYAYGGGAHAEGNSVIVGHGYENINGDTRYAYGGHGEGLDVAVVGIRAHGEGQGVMAAGSSSHAEGDGTEGVDYWKDFASGSVLAVNANSKMATISKLDVLKRGDTLSNLKAGDIITYNAVYVRISTIFPIIDSTEYQLNFDSSWYGPDMNIDISTINSGENIKFFVFRSSFALGSASHIEGKHNKSIGVASHAEGSFTVASGDNSHSGGEGTIAQGNNQTAIGKYNISDSTSLFIVGNGTSSVRSNAMKLDASGNLSLAGAATATVNSIPGVGLGIPIGTIAMWPTNIPPNGWEICNGAVISIKSGTSSDYDFVIGANYYYKTTDQSYRELAKLLKTTYGYSGLAPSGLTGIKLPDFSGRFPLGVGESTEDGHRSHILSSKSGKETVTLTAAQSGLPAHTHPIKEGSNNIDVAIITSGQSYGDRSLNSGKGSSAFVTVGENTAQNASDAHENMPPYLTINFIIKYR